MNDTKDNNDTKEDDDAEKMRLAFEAFMLTGKKAPTEEKNDNPSSSLAASNKSKKKKKKKNKSSLGGGGGAATPPKSSVKAGCGDNNASSAPSPAMAKSDMKRYYQLLRSFNDKVQHTWFDLDDQLLSVLQNIVSIRGRLPLEWKILHSSSTLKRDNDPEQEEKDDQEGEWKYHGLLGKPKEVPYSFHLHTADVELALSHDLTQHEKMLAGVRSLMSNLSECHEALGRGLDTLWKFHLECTHEDDGCGDNIDDDDMQHIVDCGTEMFQMLSMELYRKQSLVPLILESTDDEIIGIERGDGGKGSLGSSGGSDGNGRGGLETARRCCKSWQRSCEESCIDENLISYVMKLGETS